MLLIYFSFQLSSFSSLNLSVDSYYSSFVWSSYFRNEDMHEDRVGLETWSMVVDWVVLHLKNLRMVYEDGVELHKVHK